MCVCVCAYVCMCVTVTVCVHSVCIDSVTVILQALTEWASCSSYRNAPERSSSYGSQNVQSDDSNTDALQQNSHYSSLVEPSERARRQFADRLTLHQSGSARSAQKESNERSPQANQSSSSRMVHEKRLCGGVYSSPMPIGKVRTSAREVKYFRFLISRKKCECVMINKLLSQPVVDV